MSIGMDDGIKINIKRKQFFDPKEMKKSEIKNNKLIEMIEIIIRDSKKLGKIVEKPEKNVLYSVIKKFQHKLKLFKRSGKT